MVPGPWSQAVAAAMAEAIDSREGKRDRFSEEAGFSSRLSALLNGKRSWYLEDVERACAALGWDMAEFLAEVDPASSAAVVPMPKSDRREIRRAAKMDDGEGELQDGE